MSLNHSIKAVQRRRRELQWQAKGKALGEWLVNLEPIGWMAFGAILLKIWQAKGW